MEFKEMLLKHNIYLIIQQYSPCSKIIDMLPTELDLPEYQYQSGHLVLHQEADESLSLSSEGYIFSLQ